MCDFNSKSTNISGSHTLGVYSILFTMYDLRFKIEKANHKSKIVILIFLLNFSGNNT